MTTSTPGKCFTIKYQGLTNKIFSNKATFVSNASNIGGGPKTEVFALWDTGATGSLITPDLAKKLGLMPVSKTTVSTPSGQYDANIYYIDLYLPNHVRIINVKVVEGIPTGCDILIGMNIISLGDFVITNKEGKTVFSFRIPSMTEIDFCVDSYIKPAHSNKIGRNEPCPCGSGIKYKKCCG